MVSGTATGRWRRLYDSAVNVKWFGAKGNGDDDSAALVKSVEYAVTTGSDLYFPPLTYIQGNGTDKDIRLVINGANGITIYGYGATIQAHSSNPTTVNCAGFVITNSKNITVKGLTYDGRLDTRTALGNDNAAVNMQHGFYIVNSNNNIKLIDVTATRCMMDGVDIGSRNDYYPPFTVPTNIVLQNIISTYNYRQGLSCGSVNGLVITGGSYSFTGKLNKTTAPSFGIDFEGNAVTDTLVNVSVANTLLEGNVGGGVSFHKASKYIKFSGSTIQNNEGPAINFSNTSGGGSTVENCLLINNCISGAEAIDIKMNDYNSRLINNKIFSSTKQAINATGLTANAARRIITGNYIEGTKKVAGVPCGSVIISASAMGGDVFEDNMLVDIEQLGGGFKSVQIDGPGAVVRNNYLYTSIAATTSNGFYVQKSDDVIYENNVETGYVLAAPNSTRYMKSTKNLNYLATQSAPLISGNGAPDGVITAPPGSIYRRLDGSSRNVLYVKESGTDNTGWVVYYAPGIATTAVAGMVKQSAAMADSGAASVAALVGDFNLLLSKLRTAGMLAV